MLFVVTEITLIIERVLKLWRAFAAFEGKSYHKSIMIYILMSILLQNALDI
jgi:hypothetical protein